MNELDFIVNKWEVDCKHPSPIMLPDKTRADLARIFPKLGYRVGAEIGTGTGSYAITICINNTKCKLYCVDPWESYEGLNDYPDQNMLNEWRALAQRRLSSYKGIEVINELSMDAVKRFDDGSLDFVYIDANHEFPFVAEDIFHWAKKVRLGGIVSGHDYMKIPRDDGMIQVKEVVHAYTEAFDIEPWFVLNKCTTERAGSFFWVKQ
jgi:hypothetical protein